MPLYTYRCKECEHQFDIRQSFSEDPLVDCPNCQEAALRKVINQVGVVFKGKGFYVNDSKSNNSAAPGGKAKADSSDANGKDGGAASSASDGGTDSKSSESPKSESSSPKPEKKAATKATSD